MKAANKITSWTYDKPTEEGDYLCCYGDVETPKNVEFIRIDEYCVRVFSNSYKFARLVYAPSELKELE